jgi:hypothetical protein
MSPDLRHATVFVKPLLGADEAAVIKALRTNTAYLQSQVARRVNTNMPPSSNSCRTIASTKAAALTGCCASQGRPGPRGLAGSGGTGQPDAVPPARGTLHCARSRRLCLDRTRAAAVGLIGWAPMTREGRAPLTHGGAANADEERDILNVVLLHEAQRPGRTNVCLELAPEGHTFEQEKRAIRVLQQQLADEPAQAASIRSRLDRLLNPQRRWLLPSLHGAGSADHRG